MGICGECGFLGLAERRKHGRDDLELVLWGLLVVSTAGYVGGYVIAHFVHLFPGLVVRGCGLLGKAFLVISVLYTIWRLSTEGEVCPKCGHEPLIPPDSPRGEKIRREVGGGK